MTTNATKVFATSRATTPPQEFAAFDQLPLPVRKALANAPYKICALTIWEAMEEKGYSTAVIVNAIGSAVAKAQREQALVPTAQ